MLVLTFATFRKLHPQESSREYVILLTCVQFPALGTSCINVFTRLASAETFLAGWLGSFRLSSGLARLDWFISRMEITPRS